MVNAFDEVGIVLRSGIVGGVLLFADYRCYKWLGMSPMFGLFKEDGRSEEKVMDFAFAAAMNVVVAAIGVYLYGKARGRIDADLSFVRTLLYLLIPVVAAFTVAFIWAKHKLRVPFSDICADPKKDGNDLF